jgi:hypothetical protein
MKFLLVLGVVVIAGALMVGFRMYRDRNATSMEGTMRQFQRGLEALDPSNDPLARPETRASLRRTSNGPSASTGLNGSTGPNGSNGVGSINGTNDSARQQNPASGRDNGSAQER